MESPYYHSKETVEEYIRLAEGFSGENLIEQLKQVLSPGSRVLEIGSGPGTDWSILSKTYQVVGSDNSAEFLHHLVDVYPYGQFLLLDAITLDTDEQFDAIYSNKVLHHLKDVELLASIKRQHLMLHDGGIICHSFWKGEGSEIFKGLFVNYHDESHLKQAYGAHFEILSIDEYKEFEEGDSLLLIGRKRLLQ